MNGILFVALLLGTITTGWAAFVVVWPTVAKARFVERVSEIRDVVDDAIIEGTLPDSEDVQVFIAKADSFLEEPGHISLSLLFAIHSVCVEENAQIDGPEQTYARLSAEQRKFMHTREEEMVAALARYLVRGSRFAVPMWCARGLLRSSDRVRESVPKGSMPGQLAQEFNRVRNPRTFQHV